MNSQLLLKHKVNLLGQYRTLLNFIHPDFYTINSLEQYNCNMPGIIYTGDFYIKLISELNALTNNWIILSNKTYDTDLTTNEGLVKYLMPVCYAKLKNVYDNNHKHVYNNISYDLLLEKIKLCLINNTELTFDSLDNSVYDLFCMILSSYENLSSQYFITLNDSNIDYITSSVLTFLSRVQTNSTVGLSNSYASLIKRSNMKYGKYIKQGISNFVKSKANKKIALYNLLIYLNKV